ASVTSRSGSAHRHHGSTVTISDPAPAASARKPDSTFDAHGSPRRTTTSGRRARRAVGERRTPSAAATTWGWSTRHPDRGSANTGQPSRSANCSTAAGGPLRAPATTTPRPPDQRATQPSTSDGAGRGGLDAGAVGAGPVGAGAVEAGGRTAGRTGGRGPAWPTSGSRKARL